MFEHLVKVNCTESHLPLVHSCKASPHFGSYSCAYSHSAQVAVCDCEDNTAMSSTREQERSHITIYYLKSYSLSRIQYEKLLYQSLKVGWYVKRNAKFAFQNTFFQLL